MSKPLVTVGIPVYNFEKYIDFCLRSVLSQTYRNVEVIVVDDRSADATGRRLKKYGVKVKIFYHRVNHGNVATYNDLIERARGKYFSLLSGDDGLKNDCLARSVAILEKNPRVGLTYTAVEVIDEKDEVVKVTKNGEKNYLCDRSDFERMLVAGNFIATPGVVMRTKILREVGGYDPAFPATNDWDMWLKVSQRYCLAYIGEPLAYYRVHPTSSHVANEKSGMVYREIGQLYEKWFCDRSVSQAIRRKKKEAMWNRELVFIAKCAYNKTYFQGLVHTLRALLIKPYGLVSFRLPIALCGLVLKKGREVLKSFLPRSPGGSSLREQSRS